MIGMDGLRQLCQSITDRFDVKLTAVYRGDMKPPAIELYANETRMLRLIPSEESQQWMEVLMSFIKGYEACLITGVAKQANAGKATVGGFPVPIGFTGVNAWAERDGAEGAPFMRANDGTHDVAITCWQLTPADLEEVIRTGVVWVGHRRTTPAAMFMHGRRAMVFATEPGRKDQGDGTQ